MNHRETFQTAEANFFNVHDNYKSLEVNELREICRQDRRNFRLCALNVEGDLNVGMMIRSASLFGAEKAYIFGRRRIDNRSLVGVQNYIDIEKIHGLDDDGILDLKEFADFVFEQTVDNYAIVMVEQGGTQLGDLDWADVLIDHNGITLIMGNENSGIPAEFLPYADYVVSIPQRGVLRSFNVAAAANIVMWDMAPHMENKQRKIKG